MSRRRAAKAVFGNLPAQGVAMDAEDIGRLTQVAIGLTEHMGDELLLELAPSVFETHTAGHHFVDQAFELFFQHHEGAMPPVATTMSNESLAGKPVKGLEVLVARANHH